MMHGGVQEGGRRAGTENVPAIIGAGLACEIALREMPKRIAHTAKLQKRLWDGLKKKIPYIKLNGPNRRTKPHFHQLESQHGIY